jgi:hypothetical protein
MNRVILALGFLVFIIALIAVLASGERAKAQDSFMSERPQGFAGEGHPEHHHNYEGLRNSMGGSCCNGKDGRPTQGRWNPETESWEAMVNGQWQTVPWPNVVDDGLLAAQGRQRWDNQSHVFASPMRKPDGTYQIWCFIPGESGQ